VSPTPQVHISPPPRVPASPPPRSPPAPSGRLETLAPAGSDRLGTPEIDETLSISVELQQRILDLSSRLGELDHFELLGIPRGADRAAVKHAYFSMIGTFHPDRYFSKRIGGFTKRMEKIFQRLTEAHDVLSNAQAREEYESYLAALGRTRGLDGSSPPDVSVEDLERLLMQAEEQAKHKAEPAPSNKPSTPPPANGSASTAARRVSAPPAASAPARGVSARPGPAANASAKSAPQPAAHKPPPLPAQPRLPSHRPLQLIDDPVARRQALARKFGRVPPPSTPPGVGEAERNARAARQTAAAQELQQRYEQRKGEIHDQRIERYAKAAEEAIAAGNNVAALNSLKLARSISGDDATMLARIDELEKRIGSTVTESYLQRARYEETNGQYAEAARSYTRAARGRPHPDVFRSAAECYLKAGVELRLAGDLAKEGVQMAPDRTDLRLTLAKIYEAAGMPQSAVKELERAQEISPESERVTQWLKRLKRGGV
jgi:hypothetical protein